ncbi:Putative uncharacterized protein [Pararhodospirillum photometricum DSM 122]|uniref:16S rRNA (Guanine(966)-N(2))-methyltransferase RsmD n=2 Tax=Pararhodospirillum photometricum TaxID=1084 RepID=H6SMS9_PARPM|nr:Putative uncharacterized protein [Pararhodospirillum photometricum DSM 122]
MRPHGSQSLRRTRRRRQAMRIVAGRWRGRTLAVPPGLGVRPTGDRARGAVFNIVTHRFEGRDGFSLKDARVLDAFAGSGALGLEALSQGAASATFFETDAAALAVVRANVAACQAQARTAVRRVDACRPPPPDEPVGLALLDPPYAQSLLEPALVALATTGWLAPGCLVYAESDGRAPAPAWPDGFSVVDERTQGRPRLTFLRWGAA